MQRMRLAGRIIFLMCAALLAGGCGAVVGSGHVVLDSRPVRGFSGVELAGPGNVVIEQTGADSLTVEAEDNLQLLLEAQVVDGWLHLGVAPNAAIRPTRPITFHVTIRTLHGLYNGSAGSMSVPHVATDTLQVVVAGSGAIAVAGTAQAQAVRVAGSGSYAAKQLETASARIEMTGSGHAEVTVNEQLDVTVSGSGSVEYFGHPVVKENVTGSGSIVSK